MTMGPTKIIQFENRATEHISEKFAFNTVALEMGKSSGFKQGARNNAVNPI